MGKGDRKSRKGKITMGSYGVRRPKKSKPVNKPEAVRKEIKEPDTVKPVKTVKPAAPKAEKPKKPAAAKKT